jgi:hypothetical protein
VSSRRLLIEVFRQHLDAGAGLIGLKVEDGGNKLMVCRWMRHFAEDWTAMLERHFILNLELVSESKVRVMFSPRDLSGDCDLPHTSFVEVSNSNTVSTGCNINRNSLGVFKRMVVFILNKTNPASLKVLCSTMPLGS